ncbi:N-alpha-acetyltransferase 80-like isoform X1 [Patiria miniata]|uniref:N-acetyltransferase domain-containing protein n=1 Tax=Patiria miniata TaxID=46514 RepID=A0A913Z3Q8_PATMI|nr:N-alpha-acetyltransferase 80-like isoform X1 [Patiria miniata]XP_038046469.1 N-alpha-acetyltransferase 80-like isoform X1 [Patiria miniata]
MAVTYTLIPLHLRQDFIPACIKVLKHEWPQCKAELLPRLENAKCTGLSCSLGLIEHRDHALPKDTVIGHVRFVPVTNRPKAVFIEGQCIDGAKRGRGLGKIIRDRTEEFLGKLGYHEVHLHTDASHKGFYLRQGYRVHKFLVHTGGANLLRTFGDVASWHGNTASRGWEEEYEGPIATEEEVTDGVLGFFFVKSLVEVSTQD